MTQVRSFNRPIKLLLLNQLTINIGFYMLMPYLATYLADDLGQALWLVGLILGVRNLSQQGLFLLGGSLADRLGYKPMILAGLALRTIGFAMFGFVSHHPGLLVASALTGLAGALFNPAARAYLAEEAGERRVEAFAVFNVFYQAGILAGPLIGLLLTGMGFRWVCAVAAVVFTVLMLLQARALPARRGSRADAEQTMFADWRQALRNRPFLLFSAAMAGSYVLNFQVYLGLPIEVRRLTGGTVGVTALFVLSGLIAIAGQVRITAWAKAQWTQQQAIVRGLLLMGVAFLPLAATAHVESVPHGDGWGAQVVALLPVLVSTALLTLATVVVYPFEMATVTTLGGQRMVGTYYGLYSTISGIGIAGGNLLTGAAIDAARGWGIPAIPWLALAATGAGCAVAVYLLGRARHLDPVPEPELVATRS